MTPDARSPNIDDLTSEIIYQPMSLSQLHALKNLSRLPVPILVGTRNASTCCGELRGISSVGR